jgi:hypothetical protein
MISTSILVAVVLGRFIIWPGIQAHKKSEIMLTSLESVVSQHAGLDILATTLESKLSSLKEQMRGNIVDLPDNQMESIVIGQLQSISWENKIEVMGVKPAKGSTIQALEEVLFEVEVAGDYFNLYTWLQDVSNKLGFVVIKYFNIRPLNTGANNPRLIAKLTIASYRVAGNA